MESFGGTVIAPHGDGFHTQGYVHLTGGETVAGDKTFSGRIFTAAGTAAAPAVAFASSPGVGVYLTGSGNLGLSGPLTEFGDTTGTFAIVYNDTHGGAVGLGSGGGFDTFFGRDAADALALIRGTHAQTFRVYNTFTDATHFERGFMRWAGNILEIGNENTGGAARVVRLVSDSDLLLAAGGVNYWAVVSGGLGHLVAITDNALDVGEAGADPRTLRARTSFLLAGANAQALEVKQFTEDVNTNTGGATIDTAAQFPAGAVALGASARVITAVTGCTTFDVGVAGTTQRYAAGLAVALATTGGKNSVDAVASATSIRLTAQGGGGVFSAGHVRVTGYYFALTMPTS